MDIIDGQIHVWWANSAERPWPKGAESLHGPVYTPADALKEMDKAGVRRAVLVPVPWTGFDNSYALDAARKMPDRFAVMGRFDVEANDAQEQLENFMVPGMIGVRISFATDIWLEVLRDPKYDWFWGICEDKNMPIMCLATNVSHELGPIARRHRKLQIVVDHAGRNPRGEKDEACWADIDKMLSLAPHQNIAIKVSSLPSFSTQPYPFPNLRKPLKQIYEAFGARRMMWGSDITRLTSTYGENLKLFTEEIDFWSDDDLEWVMGKSLAERCHWPL